MPTYRATLFGPAACLLAALLCGAQPTHGQTAAEFERARKRMVDDVIIAAGITNERVIASVGATPRHEFVALNLRGQAYYDMALPIGEDQTISSPFIVAFMTESIDPQPGDKVLEIGTGSGYQAAVLSPLVKEVYSIEIVEPLGHKAARTLRRLRYENVFTKVGDGYQGWAEHAPFNKIIVTCSPEKVPQALADQLAEGGLMVIPVGERYQQTLYLLRKREGKLEAEALRPTLFVPMTGAAEDARVVQPDPKNPKVVNGDFELEANEHGFVPGWYYQRQGIEETATDSPQGEFFLTFENREQGRTAHALQGFPIDGRAIGQLEISAWVKTDTVRPGKERTDLPMVAISFYDESRRDVGLVWIGPWRDTNEWAQERGTFRVPITAREGILRIGLFGATGKVSFDGVKITPIPR